MTRVFHLTIKLKKFTKRERRTGTYGYITRKSDNRYVMWVNTEFTLLETIGTLYHEFSHWLFFTVFKDSVIDDDKEHEFCEELDEASKEAFKRCLGSEEEEEEEDE